MNNIEKINDILDNVMPAFNNKTVSINTMNGIMNVNFLERQRNLFLKETLEYHKPLLVNIKQDYPVNDISDVHFSAEFFIIRRNDYMKLKQLVETFEDK